MKFIIKVIMINMINIRVCKINFNVWILLTIFIIITKNHQTLMLCWRNVFKKVVEKLSLFDLTTFTYNPTANNLVNFIPIWNSWYCRLNLEGKWFICTQVSGLQ